MELGKELEKLKKEKIETLIARVLVKKMYPGFRNLSLPSALCFVFFSVFMFSAKAS
jgi:hypothetical protein